MTDELAAHTDSYFLKTKAIVGRFGDREATYAVFMRRPVICTPRLAIEFLERVAAERGTSFKIELNHPEGAWVGAREEGRRRGRVHRLRRRSDGAFLRQRNRHRHDAARAHRLCRLDGPRRRNVS